VIEVDIFDLFLVELQVGDLGIHHWLGSHSDSAMGCLSSLDGDELGCALGVPSGFDAEALIRFAVRVRWGGLSMRVGNTRCCALISLSVTASD
jgi:hypothetical protein